MIKTQDLTKVYGELHALENLTLELGEGDLFGYIGPNGSGKTTTMRILATLLQPTWGEASVCGYSIYTHPKEIRRIIGYMPDFFGVYDDMKVIEYLEFFAAAYRIKGPGRKKICNEVLDLVDLGYKRDAFVTSLSRGMTQRLGLARVLLHDPKVLILDEPASGLDPRADRDPQPAQGAAQDGQDDHGFQPYPARTGRRLQQGRHDREGQVAGQCATCSDVMRLVRPRTVLQIGVQGDLEAAGKVLEQSKLLEKIEVRPGHLLVTLCDGVTDYSDLPTLLIQSGHRLTMFKEDEINLETAFMALTKGITA